MTLCLSKMELSEEDGGFATSSQSSHGILDP
jgi:hypothetical protein